MSAERLREAAAVLRERADAALSQAYGPQPAPILGLPGREPLFGDGADWTDPGCAYVATVHPGVGLAVAALLDHAAESAELVAELHAINWKPGNAFGIALAVADAILGGKS